MIRGLEHFRNFFRAYSGHFVLVGGVASHLLLEEAGASRVRATKDLDIVLMMRPESSFLNAIKEYIKQGGYEIQQGHKNQGTFYRFQKPMNDQYPVMIELFAAVEADFVLIDDQYIVPVENDAGVESLSAILLDDEYYSIIKKNGIEKDGIFILNEFALIPFKAKAYLEIKERGEDSKNWKKHRADIINLTVTLLTGRREELLTGKVREHFIKFMEQLKAELTADVVFGACGQKLEPQQIIEMLEKTFL